MTLFGATLDGQQIAGLVGLLTLLVFWLFVLKREQGYAKWFRSWEADRKARKDAEDGVGRGEKTPPGDKRGPWG